MFGMIVKGFRIWGIVQENLKGSFLILKIRICKGNRFRKSEKLKKMHK